MNKYRVKIDGTLYEVEVEPVGKEAGTAAVPGGGRRPSSMPVSPMPSSGMPMSSTAPSLQAAPSSSPTPAPAAAFQAESGAPALAGGQQVTAPMPGNIIKVNISQGAAVKKGDVLMILEAMKMENEIMSPCDGTVASVHTASGAAVDTGAVLCVIS